MILAGLVFIRKVTSTTSVSRVTREYVESGRAHVLQDKMIPPYVAIYRIHGPFLFGTTEKLDAVYDDLAELPETVILRLRNMNAIDSTGIQALERLAAEVRKSGRTLLLCGAPERPLQLMERAEFSERVGAENVCGNVSMALKRAEELHAKRAVAIGASK